MSDGRPETTGRRSARVLMILSLLLLAGAGALVWLHVSGRLQPLLAASPSIEVELPASVATGETPPPVSEDAGSAPVAVAELAPEPAESAPPPTATSTEVAEAEPGHAAPVPAGPAEPPAEADQPPAEDAPTPGAEAPVPATPPAADAPPAAVPAEDTAAPAAPDEAEAADAARQAAEAEAAPEVPPAEAAEADAAGIGEAGAADTAPERAEAELAAAQAADEPPPPAPPVPELPAEPAAEGTAAEPPAAPEAGGGHEPAEGTGPAPPEPAGAAAGHGESPADNPQTAAATVPPGVVPTWQRLARPFPPDENRPRIAVVVAGLGLSEAATMAAIQQLPAEVTLSFSPYSNRIEEWVAMARAAGHEVLIDLPMEPASFPRDDPGPQALLTSADASTNAERLAWVLSRTDGFLGVATFMGSRFTTSAEHMRPVLEELARRGLLILDSRSAADSLTASLAAEENVAHAINDRFIDNEASRVAIDGRLQQIERIARTSGVAVAMGYAYPVTVERLREWVRGLAGKGLTLAPISAVADRQEVR